MTTVIHERVERCRQGNFDQCIARMPSGWAVLGDVQFLQGYCLLLPDPVVPDLNALSMAQRQLFLLDMTHLGDAVLAVTKAARINYEMLGNLEPALHAHVFPRFNNEDETLRTSPVWLYDWNSAPPFNQQTHQRLMDDIKAELKV